MEQDPGASRWKIVRGGTEDVGILAVVGETSQGESPAGGLIGKRAGRSPREFWSRRRSLSAADPLVLYCVSGTTGELELHLVHVLNEVLVSLLC